MFQEAMFKLAYIKEVQTQVLELPYAGEELSMVILLPDDHVDLSLVRIQGRPLCPSCQDSSTTFKVYVTFEVCGVGPHAAEHRDQALGLGTQTVTQDQLLPLLSVISPNSLALCPHLQNGGGDNTCLRVIRGIKRWWFE